MKARVRAAADTPMGREVGEMAFHAAKSPVLAKDADTTARLVDSVAKLIDSLKDQDPAIIRAGSVLLVKNNAAGLGLLVVQLSPAHQAALSRNPGLLMNPAAILSELAEVAPLNPVDLPALE
jgi:hypothetical protein